MSNEESLLDKIIISKQSSDISSFNPSETVSNILKYLSNKEEDILRKRYGLNGKKEETLEEIGKSYKVTRERIRQIEHSVVSKIKSMKELASIITPVEHIITNLTFQYGGVMEKNFFHKKILEHIGESEINKSSVNFLLSKLLDNKFEKISGPDFREGWKLNTQNINFIKDIFEEFTGLFKRENRPLSQEEIIEMFKKTEIYKAHQNTLTDDVLISYLNLCPKISKNPFGDYGLNNWVSIKPKRMNDKISLIMKKNGKPLHFIEIAELINKSNFDHKKAYPPTVHNELILNDGYVLVGRGIYALKEWGYKPGVVADVLIGILKEENRPLTREYLIKKVLEKRIVKKNTILLALTDKNKFKKVDNGEYVLNE